MRAFEQSAFVRAAFGESVAEHLAHFARAEIAAYDRFVTDFEKARFFERG